MSLCEDLDVLADLHFHHRFTKNLQNIVFTHRRNESYRSQGAGTGSCHSSQPSHRDPHDPHDPRRAAGPAGQLLEEESAKAAAMC